MRTGSGRKMHMFGCRNEVFHQKLIGSRQGRRWFFSLCLTADGCPVEHKILHAVQTCEHHTHLVAADGPTPP